MKKICVLLTDPLKVYYQKGEIKEGYYNPCDLFDEVHMISFCDKDIDPELVKMISGKGKLIIHTAGGINLFNLPGQFKKRRYALEMINNIAPDVIRSYDPFFCGWIAAYSGRRLSIPVVVSVHNNFSDVRKSYLQNHHYLKFLKSLLASLAYERYVFKNANKIICAYKFVAEYVKRYKVKGIEVVYNKIDTDNFRPRESKEVAIRPKIICVGRLIKEKGQDILIKAVEGLDVDLLLIGNGPRYAKLVELINRMALNDKVKILKVVPNTELSDYYRSSDVFVTAIQWAGVSIPVLEAMATGLPVIASLPKEKSFLEFVTEAGLIVKDNSPEAFRQEIKRILDDANLREKLSKKGREIILAVNKQEMENKESAIYRHLMGCNN